MHRVSQDLEDSQVLRELRVKEVKTPTVNQPHVVKKVNPDVMELPVHQVILDLKVLLAFQDPKEKMAQE